MKGDGQSERWIGQVVPLRTCNARRHKASVAETKLTAISKWCLDGRLLLQ